jgi:hypothetical protein
VSFFDVGLKAVNTPEEIEQVLEDNEGKQGDLRKYT